MSRYYISLEFLIIVTKNELDILINLEYVSEPEPESELENRKYYII